MAHVTTYCKNQSRRSGDKSKDNNGYAYIFCRLNKEMCIAQRWCPEQQKYIVSERACKICKKYEG